MEIVLLYWKPAFFMAIVLLIVLLVSRSIHKAGCVIAGYGLYALLGELYDTVLWPIIQGSYGAKGAIGMSLGAVAINFTVLFFYQRQKIDWLGISVIDTLMSRSIKAVTRLRNHPSWVRIFIFIPIKMIHFFILGLKTPWSAFVILSTFGDSFLATAFMRQGRFGPIERRDVAIFLTSSLVSCGFWVIWNSGIVTVFQQLLRIFV